MDKGTGNRGAPQRTLGFMRCCLLPDKAAGCPAPVGPVGMRPAFTPCYAKSIKTLVPTQLTSASSSVAAH
jgi:hypothetical protein